MATLRCGSLSRLPLVPSQDSHSGRRLQGDKVWAATHVDEIGQEEQSGEDNEALGRSAKGRGRGRGNQAYAAVAPNIVRAVPVHFGSRTLSMTWMTPLSARTFAEITLASFTVTPLADLVTRRRP